MATPATTGRPSADRSPARTRPQKRAPDTAAKRNPRATRSRQTEARDDAASKAVAVTFARILAERYPGTSWLPVKPPRDDDGLVVPAGKIVRLLPGPANVDTSGGIGNPAASAACERAPYEYRSNPGA